MKPAFKIEITSVQSPANVDDRWTEKDLIAVLDAMSVGDVDGLSAAELREMCLMSLQDCEPNEAAAVLLHHRLGEHLSDGQIQHLSNEMLHEKLWEEYADMTLHELFYEAAVLLNAAFPDQTPTPDAVDIHFQITPTNQDASTIVAHGVTESLLVRMLAGAVPDGDILKRLFAEQLAGKAFPESEHIIWRFTSEKAANSVACHVIGSSYFFGDVSGEDTFDSNAIPDEKIAADA